MRFLVLLVAGAFAAPQFNTPEFAEYINSQKAGWTAHVSPRFVGATEEDVKTLCGTWTVGHENYNRLPEKPGSNYNLIASAIPDDFDARTNWPECANIIGHIRDQSSCGSCWAHGPTEAFNDRHCIVTGDNSTSFSVEDTNACCKAQLSSGCNGGQPSGAWSWFSSKGVVTGGDFSDVGTGKSCKPYSMAPCAHHVDPTPEYPACPEKDYPTPKCASTCSESGYKNPFESDKHFVTNSYSVSGVTKIQTEIMTNGPVSAAFTVYSDFPTYKSGVYQHVSGSALGGHAIKILGWGVESGTPYWLVANSWNPTWGDGGYFKILRGSNHCGIEGDISAGIPK